MRVTLFHNPGAGAQTDADGDKLIGLLRDAGHEVRYQSCEDKDWKRTLQAPADLVAVAGGDGTVARVAKAMVGRGIPVAPLPGGTANNICRTLGLVDRHWEELVRGWETARRVKLDVGVAKGPWGERYFIEGVGTGLFAGLLASADPARDQAQSMPPAERTAHALAVLADQIDAYEAMALKATLDGRDMSGRYLLFEAVSIAYVGPNLFLAPDSQPGDGTLDLVLVTEEERERLKNNLAAWQSNRERLSVLPSHRGKHLRMDWTGFDLHIDDELWPQAGEVPARAAGSIDIRIGEAQVEFLAPDSKQR